MRKTVFLILMSLLIAAPIVSQASAQWFMFQNPILGKSVEDFSLKNLRGEEQQLSVLRGDDPAIIFFWATWCPHCRTSLAELNKNADEIAAKGIQIILVDLGESSNDVEKYLNRNGIAFNVLLDQSGDVAGDYGVQGIPTFVFVNAKGIVKAVEHEIFENYEEILLEE